MKMRQYQSLKVETISLTNIYTLALYLELVLLPIDDNRGDLLVHEEKDGEKQGRDAC